VRNITNLCEKRVHFKCECCKAISLGKVSVYCWHLFSGESLTICNKCAKRELGTKNKQGWETLHEK